MATYSAKQITDNVYWVGAIDWDLRDFHGYLTDCGTSYNAFLIMADKVTLVDTVKKPFCDEMMQRIASVVDPEKIDYVVSLHAEMDHSACIPHVIEACKPEAVYASAPGVDALHEHFGLSPDLFTTVRDDTISLGNMNLTFVPTRMLHWPDSMVAYLDADKMLLTQDAFGMHLAADECFADELPFETIRYQSAKYFANILTPFAKLINKAVAAIKDGGLEIEMIAPDHGPIWRENPMWIIDKYVEWAEQKPSKTAVVVYHSMWGSTEKMAHAICEGLNAGGAKPKLMGLAQNHRSDIATDILTAGAFVVGSPTLNRHHLPIVADVICYVKGLSPKNLVGGVFGSYGWKSAATDQLELALNEIGIEQPAEPIAVKYVPTEEDLEACKAFGAKIAKRLMEYVEA